MKYNKVNYNSQLLKCGWHIVTSFKRVHCGRRMWEDNFTVQKTDKHYHSQIIKVNINSNKSCWQYVALIWFKESGLLLLWSSSQKQYPQFNQEKTSDKSQFKYILQNWPVLLRTAKVIKTNKSLKLPQLRGDWRHDN